MSFLDRFFRREIPKHAFDASAIPPPGVWPNNPLWSALAHERTVETPNGPYFLRTIPCGDLLIDSGKLVACDPFVCWAPEGTPFIHVPKGRFPVSVTLADVSEKQDRSHFREAYASIVFARGTEAYRKSISLAAEGEPRPEPKGDEFSGFPVDAGTACFVDESFARRFMPPPPWLESHFENKSPEAWFNRMDDPNHIREGIANITLPLAKNGENLILFHSGWGDGVYPVIGSYDAKGTLLAAHIDFFVVPSSDKPEESDDDE